MTRAGEEIAIPVNLRRGEMGRWLVSKWVEASLESPREQDKSRSTRARVVRRGKEAEV